jgi:16S rRNA (adenine1518-N6/adenine1519-N6)-dimethyltransferase
MPPAAPALPPLGEVIRRHGLGARKALGQNFLLDLNLTRRIARAAGPLEGFHVVEVGPGPGGLTRALLLEGAGHVSAIERDQRCLPALAELAEAFPGRLTVIPGDALAIDPATLGHAPRKLVANLPYNIATALLLNWLPHLRDFASLTLMFQKEVAQRLVAAPGSKSYGRLSVVTQWLAEIELLFDISPKAFVPPPKVISTVVRLTPRAVPLAECRMEDLERATAAAFGQRRKMLRQSLKSLGDAATLITAAGIDPTARAETLTVEQFCALARAATNSHRADD